MTLTKAQSLSDDDPVHSYEQMIEDFDYSEQQMVVFAHMSLKEFEETDYYRLIEVMNAKPRNKRPKTLWEFAEEIDKKGGN
ncbi:MULTISPECIES: hypothetical protein [unclassified Lactobacillus]|uniref:hypothetical protein n=1 Tax=unclassified Lactobacillus TaxID=2620435 RepID=UPI002269CE4D|nr:MULTISPECIES: hypothetical protein [unclassified Lactobacillus]